MIEIETENKTISSCLTFHNTEFPPSLLQEMYTPPSPIEREHFGVLEINIPKEKISNDVIWDIVFSIDNSGSMSDFCSDNKSKMEHIKHTLRNILKLFSTNKEIHALSTPQSSTEFIRTTTPIKGSIVLQNSGFQVSSPEKDISEDMNFVILHYNPETKSYGIDTEITQEKVANILDTKCRLSGFLKPLRGVSTYKVEELEEMGNKMGLTWYPKIKKNELFELINNEALWV